jgi:hypothetical protein
MLVRCQKSLRCSMTIFQCCSDRVGPLRLTLLGPVLGVQNAQFGEHSLEVSWELPLGDQTHHMGSLETQTALHKADNLIKVAVALVERQKSGQLFSVHLLSALVVIDLACARHEA